MENLNLEVIEKREEVVTLSKNAEASLAYAEALKIKTEEDHTEAVANLKKIRDEKQRGDSMRRFFTDPLNEQIKKINTLFQPTIRALESAERMIRSAMIAYQDLLAKKAEDAKAKTMEKIDAGKLSVEQGVKKIENIKTPDKTVRTEAATVSYTIRPRVEIEDESKLPREYLCPDMVKIKAVALAFHKAKQPQIPGVKIVEDKVPSIRGN